MKTKSNEFLALITGAAIGTVVAMLYAPERGADIRRKISDTANTALDAVTRAAEELKGKAEVAIEEGKGTLESRLSSLIDNTHHKPVELIELLEGKLAVLKKKAELKEKNAKQNNKPVTSNAN